MKTTKCENVKFRQYNGKSLENFRPLMCSLHISTIVLVVVGGLECLESFKKYFGTELVNPAIYLSIIDPDLRDKDFQMLAEIFYTLKYT